MSKISLEGLIEQKTWHIFKTFLSNPHKIFHLNSLAKSSKVPVSTTSRVVKKLVKHGFADEIKVGKISVYKLADNKKIREIKKII